MAHLIQIRDRDHFVAALRVLDKLPGMWQSRGPAGSPALLVLDSHYEALVKAGVISPNGKQEKSRGKKTPVKKGKS